MKSLVFTTLYVLICDYRAWPRANTLLYPSHPASCGDVLTWYNLPPVGFQRSFYPFCECLSGPHRVSDNFFNFFLIFLFFTSYKCTWLLIWTKLFIFSFWGTKLTFLHCKTCFHRPDELWTKSCTWGSSMCLQPRKSNVSSAAPQEEWPAGQEK